MCEMFIHNQQQIVSDSQGANSLSKAVVIGIASGCSFLVLSLIGLGIYAILQKKRAEKAIGLSRPFGNFFLFTCHQYLKYALEFG